MLSTQIRDQFAAYNRSQSPAASLGDEAAEFVAEKIALLNSLPPGSQIALVDDNGEELRRFTVLPKEGDNEMVESDDGRIWSIRHDTAIFYSPVQIKPVRHVVQVSTTSGQMWYWGDSHFTVASAERDAEGYRQAGHMARVVERV